MKRQLCRSVIAYNDAAGVSSIRCINEALHKLALALLELGGLMSCQCEVSNNITDKNKL
jgi:hypothetical protein